MQPREFVCPQIVDPSILKQYIFQKGFITEAAKAKRDVEAQNATLQVQFHSPLAILVEQTWLQTSGTHNFLLGMVAPVRYLATEGIVLRFLWRPF